MLERVDVLFKHRLVRSKEEERERVPLQAGRLAFHHLPRADELKVMPLPVFEDEMKERAYERRELIVCEGFQHRVVVTQISGL